VPSFGARLPGRPRVLPAAGFRDAAVPTTWGGSQVAAFESVEGAAAWVVRQTDEAADWRSPGCDPAKEVDERGLDVCQGSRRRERRRNAALPVDEVGLELLDRRAVSSTLSRRTSS
jgi:hypothetical protein